jgi:alpha-1,2-mannosyltransferase
VIRIRPVLATAFAGVVALGIARDFVHKDMIGVDFHTYLAAAIVGMTHGWSHIYDPSSVDAVQRSLDPRVWTQQFLSTPPVALLVAPLAALPYGAAYYAWAVLNLAALAGALAWSTRYRGAARWLAVAAAFVPWWVLHAVHVGQVAPLIAAAVLVAWRLLRDDHDVAAGLVLAALALKPNTALLVPVALLMTARYRALASWLGASAVLALVSIAIIGPSGVAAYASSLVSVPANALRGAAQLTVMTAFHLSPEAGMVARVAILAVVLAAMYRLRHEVGMTLAVAAAGSLLVITYLHGSDLCLFLAAGWIVWSERTQPAWRAVLACVWVLSTPFLENSAMSPTLNRWVVCELLVLGAFVVDAFGPSAVRSLHEVLTGWAASWRRAPA